MSDDHAPKVTAVSGQTIADAAATNVADVSTPSFDAIYAFGDSLSDAGNASFGTSILSTQEPVSPPYYSEDYDIGPITASESVFSNGTVWVQDLSQSLGLGTLAPSLLPGAGGTDYAIGGGETGTTDVNTADIQDLTGTSGQLSQFEGANATADTNALYTLWIGANDVLTVLEDLAGVGTQSISASEAATAIGQAVNNEIAFLGDMAGIGAKDFLVLNVPDLADTPEISALGSTAVAAARTYSQMYNSELATALTGVEQSDGLTVYTVDTYSLIDQAVADPSKYGFTDVTDPAWTGSYTSASSGTVAANASSYLFWDQVHPTALGHQYIADAAEAALAAPPCYLTGTRIATASGEVAVDDLRPGDMVVTYSGKGPMLKPVRWIGVRRVDLARLPEPDLARPIRIRRGAFAEAVPKRDLLVSRDHCILVEGRLVTAELLVNGISILRDDAIRLVKYLHVELDSHDILMAEGLKAESYLDTGNRGTFTNGDVPEALHPRFSPPHAWHETCVAMDFSPAFLAPIKARLEARAHELRTTPAPKRQRAA